MSDLLSGKLVHLTAENPDLMARSFARWNQDTGWVRFLDTDPPRLFSAKKMQEWLEKGMESDSDERFFAIRTIDGNELIGFIGYFNLFRQHGDTLVAIALGERNYWNNGFGTDSMQVMLRYTFQELNLRRVGLIVFEYNPRAIRSYEKAGFTHEGRVRKVLLRDGKRWDFFYMGILREEWLAKGMLTSNGR